MPKKAAAPKGYWVQVTAENTLSQAQKVARRLTSFGYKSAIVDGRVNGRDYKRVRVGPFKTLAEARRSLVILRREPIGYLDSFVP
jgi:cell division protein FtsN